MGFTFCVYDPDVWRRKALKFYGIEYYEYFINYIDDIISVSMYSFIILEYIAHFLRLKNDKIDPPSD